MNSELIHIIALKENKIYDLRKENERYKKALKVITEHTTCDDTWDFTNRLLEGKEMTGLPYRFNMEGV